jgi:hypothetical protein
MLPRVRRTRPGNNDTNIGDRRPWDQAWRSMPFRRLRSLPKIEVDGALIAHFGPVVSAAISLVPLHCRKRLSPETETCPICGQTTAGEPRSLAILHPQFARGLSFGIGAWVHLSCFEGL